jgi:hypothetical protein
MRGRGAFLNNQKGSVILSMILALFIILTAATYFYYENLKTVRRGVYGINLNLTLRNLQQSVYATLNSQQGFVYSLSHVDNQGGDGVPNLNSCLVDPAYNCTAGEYPFTLFKDDQTTRLVDSRSTDNGFDTKLIPCGGYDDGSNDCFIKYRLTWVADCPPIGACTRPAVIIRGRVEVRDELKEKAIVSEANYNVSRRVN